MGEKIIVVSGPSGSGKSTVAHALLKKFSILEFSVSSTTRKKRKGEKNGVDYYFISPKKFREMIDRNEFIEYQEVYQDVYYGTTKAEIKRIFNLNKIPLLDIDVMGALNIRKIFGENGLLMFIHPGNIDILEKRLILRKSDDPEMIRKRLSKAEIEMTFSSNFDHIIYNTSTIEACLNDAFQITSKFLEQK